MYGTRANEIFQELQFVEMSNINCNFWSQYCATTVRRADDVQADAAGDGVRGDAGHDADRQGLPGVDGADSAEA